MSTFSKALALAILSLSASGAAAHEITQKGIEVMHPWVRETLKGTDVAAGYAKIKNTGKKPDRLVEASLKGAAKGELHETVVEENISKMRPLTEGIVIPPGQTVELKPGALHIMFLGLKTSLDPDQYVDGSLSFEKAGKMEVEFYVEPLAGTNKPDDKGTQSH